VKDLELEKKRKKEAELRKQRKKKRKEENVDPDDLEIEYLEKKLGLAGSKSDANKNWDRLDKELKEDGFAADMTGFLKSLDSGTSFLASGASFTKLGDGDSLDGEEEEETTIRDNYEEEDDDEEEEEEEEGTSEEEESSAEEGDPKQIDDEDLPSKNVSFMPSNDLYGKTSSGGPERLRSPFFQSKMSEQDVKVKKRLNGLINRLAESNLVPTASQIVALYSEFPRKSLNEGIAAIILSGLSNDVVLMTALAHSFAALVVALTIQLGAEFGAFVLEKCVLKFEKVMEEDAGGVRQDGDVDVVSKRAGNIALFLANMYNLNLTNSTLLYDLLAKMAAPEEGLTDTVVEVITLVVNEAGSKLRKDDPARLLDVIRKLQDGHEEAGKDDTKASSRRADLMLEQVYALKNNKVRNVVAEERIKRVMKTLRNLINNSTSTFTPLQLEWEDLVHAEERGRWWVVGGVWKDQADRLARNKEKQQRQQSTGIGGNPIDNAIARAPSDLVPLAKKLRLNTDVRRAIFYEMMSADDAMNAYDKLMALNLRDRQEREIVHVLLLCCGASKTHNLFFSELAEQLCEQRQQFKFTFQLAFWDTLKELENMKSRKLANLGRLLSHLTLQYSLSLSLLKTVDFARLGEQSIFFFNVFFNSFLLYGGEGKDGARRIARAINRLGSSKDFDRISDGIQLFLKHHLLKGKNPLLGKRVKLAYRILEALAVAQSMDKMNDDDDEDDEEQDAF